MPSSCPGCLKYAPLENKLYPLHTDKKETVYPNTSILGEDLENRYTHWITDKNIIAAFKGFESNQTHHPEAPATLNDSKHKNHIQSGYCATLHTDTMEILKSGIHTQNGKR